MCDRIWKEVCGDEDIFEGMGDGSFRSRSSNPFTPFIHLDPFRADRMRNSGNEIAVNDEEEQHEEEEEDTWSDVSV
jgi:hypothetical protein